MFSPYTHTMVLGEVMDVDVLTNLVVILVICFSIYALSILYTLNLHNVVFIISQ